MTAAIVTSAGRRWSASSDPTHGADAPALAVGGVVRGRALCAGQRQPLSAVWRVSAGGDPPAAGGRDAGGVARARGDCGAAWLDALAEAHRRHGGRARLSPARSTLRARRIL